VNRKQILEELEASYENQRRRNGEEEDRRLREAEARIPGLADALNQRMELIHGGVRGILFGSAAMQDLPARMELANQSVTQLLTRAGYPADWLDPVYRCPVCRDTGYVGEPLRQMCDCMRNAYNERLYASIGLSGSGSESFEAFNLNLFPDRIIPQMGCSQRMLMQITREKCRKWAEEYPYAEKRDMVFSGKSGLGKTYMLHAIARRLLERGINVLIVSAYTFLLAAKKASFGRAEDSDQELRSLIEADVLMLDDVGTEPVVEGVTIVHLFNLINERQLAGRSTIISTNLNEKELQERYTERVASRMLDKRTCAFVPFAGEDIRRM